MTQDHEPTVVDLDRYKQAARAARAKAAKIEKAHKAAARESFFGSRPRAPLLLALLILAFVFLYLGPRLMHGH